MKVIRIDRSLATLAPFAFLFLAIMPKTLTGQTWANVAHRNECTQNIEARTSAQNGKQWGLLVSLARQYISSCLDLDRGHEGEAFALSDVAIGLIEQRKFEEAIPISQRCAAVKPDAAFCYVNMGEALLGLGKNIEARQAYQLAVSIGGYDTINGAAVHLAQRRLTQIPAEEPPPSVTEPETKKYGTGFIVSSQGHVLTNNHVVDGCKALKILPDGERLEVISRNRSADLALLKLETPPSSIAVLRVGPTPKLGDAVVAFGFPLPGLLSSHGNVSTGIISATSGLQDDVRFIQISAPVQPGNSGGPLFDSSGHVIGVVVSKLDAIQIARATGDVPQNVNFAVHWSEVRAFLDEEGIQYQKSPSQRSLSTSDIAAKATQVSVEIECTP